MKNILDAEFHPVMEDFISSYVDDEMGAVEKEAFDELLVHDDKLRDFAFAAKGGKRLLNEYRIAKDFDGFMNRLKTRLANKS